jgi:hypothetical protein
MPFSSGFGPGIWSVFCVSMISHCAFFFSAIAELGLHFCRLDFPGPVNDGEIGRFRG